MTLPPAVLESIDDLAAKLSGAKRQCQDTMNQPYRCGRCRCPVVADRSDVEKLIRFAEYMEARKRD